MLTVCGGLLIVAGLLAIAVNRVRRAAAVMRCQQQVKQFGVVLSCHHDVTGPYPPGTVPTKGLAPERRLSWWIDAWPYIESGPRSLIDRDQAWDAAVNDPPRERRTKEDKAGWREIGEVPYFRCPWGPLIASPGHACRTHYVGVAGAGEDAALLPLTDRRAGFFGYDRTLSHADIKDGAATTLAVVEAMDGGAWTAGGRATVRGVVAPYLGPGGPFGGRHASVEGTFPSPEYITNAVFADGSVRPLAASISPNLLEALGTIAGGD